MFCDAQTLSSRDDSPGRASIGSSVMSVGSDGSEMSTIMMPP